MASVLTPVLTDTAFPGFTRRRVWRAPEVRSHSLVLLTATRLFLVPSGVEVPADIESTADLDAALGPVATTIELSTVRRLTHALLAFTLRLESTGRPVVVRFASAEAADAAFAMLWRRLGPEFALDQPRPGSWAAARGPVAILVGMLIATLALALAASAAADLPAHPVTTTLRAMDWRVVCGLGGAALALVQVRLYRRLTCPPARLDLTRR
ncbi:MAG TPA: hypothetical protein VM533_18290 [Fimbriiglobus sp.]|jgi:hypothetical protein|nr:hypothetical protein [Fimbriiglobus sp.]